MPDDIAIICVQCRCGRRGWVRTSEVGFRPLAEIGGFFRCSGCGSRDVSAGYAESTALPVLPRVDLWASVEIWDDTGNRIEEVMARTANLGVGVAAYERTVIERPGRNVTFRHFCRVIRSTSSERAS